MARPQVLTSGTRSSWVSRALAADPAIERCTEAYRFTAKTLSISSDSGYGVGSDRTDSERPSRLELLTGVAEKVLTLGAETRPSASSRAIFGNMLQMARSRGGVDLEGCEKAVAYAVRIAEATGNGRLVEYAFELYGLLKRPLPARSSTALRVGAQAFPRQHERFRHTFRAPLVEPELGPAGIAF